MGKKFIVVNGKKVYIDEKQIGDEDNADQPTPVTPTEEPKPEGDGALEEEVGKAAKLLGAAFRKELGIDGLAETLKAVNRQVDAPENSKLKALLHGKDLVKDKDQMTADEKIVAWFHGVATKNDTILKALSEGTDADGGYLFPNEFLSELIRPLAELPRLRGLVRVVTMRRDVLNAPSLLNRPKVTWTAELGTKSTTTAAFGQATLTAKKAAAILYASDELIEDSDQIDVVRLIIDLFAEAIGEEEDRVILRGNGTTEPTGLSTAVTASTIPSVTCNGNLSFDNVLAVIYGLKAKYRSGSSFIVHPTNVLELRKLKDSQGRYMWQDPSTPEGYPSLYSYPVYEKYDMPESAIYFGNWKLAYWLGDRKRMTVKISTDVTQAFTTDATAIRVVVRLGGNVVLGEAARALVSIP
jgi:HK97 family phage major capsid protein